MRIEMSNRAIKRLAGLQPKLEAAIRTAIGRVAEDPFGRHPQMAPLKGLPEGYRLRHGDWRILLVIEKDAAVLRVLTIETRDKVYSR